MITETILHLSEPAIQPVSEQCMFKGSAELLKQMSDLVQRLKTLPEALNNPKDEVTPFIVSSSYISASRDVFSLLFFAGSQVESQRRSSERAQGIPAE
jgi:hypothetical protein